MPSASETISISIHAPREGSDRRRPWPPAPRAAFLSTLPARGATGVRVQGGISLQNFYPRSPRGERRLYFGRTLGMTRISIHAPREGSDSPRGWGSGSPRYFYPRSPRGERRVQHARQQITDDISIHAPREGSDTALPRGPARSWNFYPRSPRGERLGQGVDLDDPVVISIHAPREGSDLGDGGRGDAPMIISIHAPREGSDYCAAQGSSSVLEFLSTLPARGATYRLDCELYRLPISIHAPREGSDSSCCRPRCPRPGYFYPRSPRGERLTSM